MTQGYLSLIKNSIIRLVTFGGLMLCLSYGISVYGLSDYISAGGRVFIFDPKILTWAAYEDGELVREGHGVGGRGYCPDVHRHCRTPVGTFHIYSKMGPYFRSSKFPPPYGGAPMPWAMFFHSGFAIHGSDDVPDFNASHGCIRVYPEDARWLRDFLPYGATVIVRHY